MSYNIAVDGPAGAGKSTIAKAVARKLNLIYIDTGAMYRAIALYMIRNKVSVEDSEEIGVKCQEVDIKLGYENGTQVVYLMEEDVTKSLRTEEVGNMASLVSQQIVVREKLVELQQNMARTNDCIMDGRDIGTCVLPNADVKIYLTADSSVRAKRRFDELTAKGEPCNLQKIKEDIEERDYRDENREHSPLKRAEDAVLLDSSYMTIEEVVEQIIEIAQSK